MKLKNVINSRVLFKFLSPIKCFDHPYISSIYQDVPLHTLEEFKISAPEEARTEDVMQNNHQLMLNRLSFELAERQR